jgi:hypothetical protein
VYENYLEDGKKEFKFNLTNEQLPTKKFDNSELASSEKDRRLSAGRERFYIKLIVNGKNVATSAKANMKHPNYEVAIDEVFQLNTFTMPRSIEMDIYMVGTCCDTLVDRVAIQVPGEHVRTLTCTS